MGMPRKAKSKSARIRDLLKERPDIKAPEALATLKARGVSANVNLFYYVKGRMASKKQKTSATATVAKPRSTTRQDAVAVIGKVKALALDVGGLRTLKSIVDALAN